MKKTILKSMTAMAITFSAVAAPINVLSMEAVQARAESVKPVYKNRAEIPEQYKWKLEHIYPTKAAWEADIKKATDLANQFTLHQGKLSTSAKSLKAALDDYSTLMRIHDKAYVYASMALDVNTSNAELQDLADRAEKMSVAVKEKTSWLGPEIVAIAPLRITAFLRNEGLAPYRYFVKDILRTKNHTLSKDLEELLAQSTPLADNPEGIYGMLSKDIKFPKIKDENGQEVQLTRSNFISYMESKNREVRKQAYEAYYQTLAQYQDTFAQTLGGKVKANNLYAKARKYDTAMEASLTPNNVPTKVYDELIDTVDKSLPLMHRYMELKKKMLGVSELHMYDIYTPIVQANDSYIPYDQAKEMVLTGLKPLGEQYGKLLEEAFNGGWVDVYPTDDKRSGAYQWGAYDTHPYVLLNYEGTKDDVATIAHELGHAMQSYYTNKKQPYISSNYPIFTAEVASTMNEHLLWESEYKNAKTKEEKMYLLNQRLENFRTTLFRQTQFAEFEKVIHEKEQKGESLNAEALKALYKEINQKYYGPAMISDEEISMEWARIPHFYYNFYVYQYATSFAASTALAKQILDQGQPAFERVRDNFLAAGNSSDPISVLKAAGVDMSTAQPIEETMAVFKQTLDELEKLLNEK
ncbi:oligoendopeptidase F [Bacillus songklensis]|uniref:Oligopeptidase F n=1 Tax=Bacillus songklensis TaxID=1069116 RepID=A0ABV8B2S1_9BACI